MQLAPPKAARFRAPRSSPKTLGLLTALIAAATVVVAPLAPTPAAAAAPPAVERLAGPDRYATAAAVSAATYAPGVAVAYVASGSDFADALAGDSAGDGPVLLTADTLPDATVRELQRLAPHAIRVLGGPASVPDSVVAALDAYSPGQVQRLAGPDRYATAAAVSAATYAPGVATAYVASGSEFPDALAGGADGHGPVLLVGSTLPLVTLAELARLAPHSITVLGGPASVSDAVFAALTAANVGPVQRVAGSDRYATAAALSAATAAPGAPTVYVASGDSFADAVAGGAAHRGPLLLVGDTIPTSTMAELHRLSPSRVEVLGGPVSVSDAIVGALPVAVTTPLPNGAAGTAVAAALAQLGKPYQWGGAGPDSFDCSGLTAWAWRAAGVNLPHNSESQRLAVPGVPVALLQPGDLVFYGVPAYHVGLYIGNGNMVEAAHTGVPVRIASIQRADLVGGGRP